MNPSKSLKLRPKPVPNKYVKRLKVQGSDLMGVTDHCSSLDALDETRKPLGNSHSQLVSKFSHSVSEKSDLLEENGTLGSCGTSFDTIKTLPSHAAKPESDEVNNEPGDLIDSLPVSLTIENLPNVDKESKKLKKSKSGKQTAVHNIELNQSLPTSVVPNICCKVDSNSTKLNCKPNNLPVDNSSNSYQNNTENVTSLKRDSYCENNLLNSASVIDKKGVVSPGKVLDNNLNCDTILLTRETDVMESNQLNSMYSDSCESGSDISEQSDDVSDSLIKSRPQGRKKKFNVKSFFRKGKRDLEKLRLNAYDEDGNLNKKNMTLRDFIFFNPPHNPMLMSDICNEEESNYSNGIVSREERGEEKDVDSVRAAPRVKVGPNGKTMIDYKSLIVKSSDSIRNIKKMRALKKSKVLKETEYSNRSKLKKGRKGKDDTMSSLIGLKEKQTVRQIWSPEETLKFYKVLNEFGCDFSTMLNSFPNRTRKQLKSKFMMEDKVRCKYIDAAMMRPDTIDFDVLYDELRMKQVQKEAKQKEKEKIVQEKKERKRLFQLEYAKLRQDQKNGKNLDCFGNVNTSVRRVGKLYDAKIKRMRMYIKRMKLKYIEETGKNVKRKKQSVTNKINCKTNSVIKYDPDEKYVRFDLRNPLYEKMFKSQPEELFIQEILTKDDLDIFIGLILEMRRPFGKDWREWAERKIVDQLLRTKEECDVKQAAVEMKNAWDENAEKERLEMSYQLFSDPYDYVDPLDCNKNI